MKKVMFLMVAVLFVVGTAVAETKTTVKGEFGNYCAQSLIMGKQVTTDCTINWHDTKTHKMYCFSSNELMTEWMKNTKKHIARATEEYNKVAAEKAIEHHATKKIVQ